MWNASHSTAKKKPHCWLVGHAEHAHAHDAHTAQQRDAVYRALLLTARRLVRLPGQARFGGLDCRFAVVFVLFDSICHEYADSQWFPKLKLNGAKRPKFPAGYSSEDARSSKTGRLAGFDRSLVLSQEKPIHVVS